MFGGGLNEDQKTILDMSVSLRLAMTRLLGLTLSDPLRFEAAGDEDVEPSEVTLPALRKMLVQFERVVKKNQEMRVKFPDDPEKWVFALVASIALLRRV